MSPIAGGINTKTVAAAKISCLIRRFPKGAIDFRKVELDSIVYASTLDNHRYVTSEEKNIIALIILERWKRQ